MGYKLAEVFLPCPTSRKLLFRGTWGGGGAPSMKHLPSAQIMIPGSWDRVPNWAPCSAGSLLHPLSAAPPPPACAFSFCHLNKILKIRKKKGKLLFKLWVCYSSLLVLGQKERNTFRICRTSRFMEVRGIQHLKEGVTQLRARKPRAEAETLLTSQLYLGFALHNSFEIPTRFISVKAICKFYFIFLLWPT